MLPTRENVKTLAALHESSGELRIVIAPLAGATLGTAQTRTFTSGQSDQIAAYLDQASVDLLIRVIPAGSTVVRVAPLPINPEGPEPTPASIAEAIGLIAESDLPAALPSFRRAAGLLDLPRAQAAASSRPRQVLLTGWSEQPGDAPWRSLWSGPQIGVSEIAALASLCKLSTAEVGAVVDSASGSVALLAQGPSATLVRASRVQPGAGAHQDAARLIRETLQAAKVELPAGASIDANDIADGLHLEPERRSVRCIGADRDPAWLARFGLCAAAMQLYIDPSPAVSGLVNLHQVEPTTRPPLLEQVTTWFGAPLRAAAVIALCVLTLLGLPLGVAYARMKAVQRTVTDEPALLARNELAERELAFYKLLEQKRWPMTKLLADIAGAAPVGIVLESCEIGVGDGLNIRGKADSSELVTSFRENLNTLRIFEQVTTPSTSPLDEGVQFQLTARVMTGRAAAEAKPIDDFAAKTLAERLYGPTARKPAPHSQASDRRASRDRPRPSSSASSSRASDSGRSTGSASSSSISRSGSSQAPAADPPPPALTDAQIAKLNANQAMLEWGKRRKAAAQPGLDDATKRRLSDEAEKCKARMQEAKNADAGAAK